MNDEAKNDQASKNQTAAEEYAAGKDEKGKLPSIDLSTFVLSFASSSQMHLGLIANPMTKKTEKDLPAARQTIDIIEMLEAKTRGNRSKQEDDLFEELLYTIRMQYLEVAKTSK